MKIHLSGRWIASLCGVLLLCGPVAKAQDQRGDWSLTGADAGQSGWQKDELGLTPESVPAKFKFLWKIKLGEPSKAAHSFSEPLMAGRLINAQGFKDFVYWSSADTLFAVDSELGSLVWKKKFKAGTTSAGCGVSSLGLLMEPPVAINFNARRRRAPGTPRPPDPPAAATTERKLGVAPGGGYFGLKGIYVLTPDGMLHEQVMTTGADFAPPVPFLPAANGGASGLNFMDKTIFTATARDCRGVPNGMWAIELTSGSYKVTSNGTGRVHPLTPSAPILTPDGIALFVTGPGSGAADVHSDSVVAVAKDMSVKDWYTPDGGMGKYQYVSPITFLYKDRQLVVAPGKDGTLALLDAAALGGADHRTPLFETEAVAGAKQKHGWDGFASWQDKEGTAWVYASVSAPVALHSSAAKQNGPTTHGAIVAFKVDDATGKLTLVPAWVSGDMINPAPPRVANGVVVALAGGNAKTHAKLSVLNAATGAELYSSKDEIQTYTQLSGVSVGDSHAFFTDHNNVLYSFGIGLEH